MGVVLWPMFNPEVPSIDVQLEGKALAGSVPFLDDLARLLNVRTISSFMDNRPPPDGAGEPPPIGDPAKLGQLDDWIAGFEAAEAEREEREPWSEWFPAADGAETMHALARRLESRVDAVQPKWLSQR